MLGQVTWLAQDQWLMRVRVGTGTSLLESSSDIKSIFGSLISNISQKESWRCYSKTCCPLELSMMMQVFCVSSIQYSSHYSSHVWLLQT